MSVTVEGVACVSTSMPVPATEETTAAEAAFAVAPSVASTFTSGEGGVASVPTADAAVAMSPSAALWRMHERKEDMRSEVGGAVMAEKR